VAHEVFVSYSNRDKKAADATCAVLESRGIRCWIAPRDVSPGRPWAEAIIDAMREARVMVLIFSAHANESEQIKREVERAVARGLPIIPVRLENVLPAKSLEYFISAAHWLDAFPPPVENYLNDLAGAVKGLVGADAHDAPIPRGLQGALRRRRVGYWPLILGGAAAIAIALGVAAFATLKEPEVLAVDPFSVPARFSDATGMSGEVVTSHMLDRLNDLERQSDVYALRTPEHFVGSWEPVAQAGWFQALFRADTRIGGDVTNEGDGWVLSVRASGHGGHSVPIVAGKVAPAVDAASDWVFEKLAPYRHAIVVGQKNHLDAEALFLAGARAPENPDHLWAASSLSELYFARGRLADACSAATAAHTEDPRFIPATLDLANCKFGMGALGEAQNLINAAIPQLSRDLPADISGDAAKNLLPQLKSRLAEFSGAYLDAISLRDPVRDSRINYLNRKMPPWDASNYAAAHDVAGAIAVMRGANMGIGGEAGGIEDGKALRQFQSIGFAPSNFYVAIALDDWAGAKADLSVADRTALAFGNVNEIRHRYLWPCLAYVLVRSGDAQAGRSLAAMTPQDCYLCLEMRGRIAAIEHKQAEASYWLDRAGALASRLPFSQTDRGALLLSLGDYDGAIAQFQAANNVAPHFADPLELWGEALVGSGRSDLAIGRFEEANRYAPNWGRLHLKWGEALLWLGRKVDANGQFQTASHLGLSVRDRAELERMKNASRRA
jgi:tetratricopeptide (TPR) repeat protein